MCHGSLDPKHMMRDIEARVASGRVAARPVGEALPPVAQGQGVRPGFVGGALAALRLRVATLFGRRPAPADGGRA